MAKSSRPARAISIPISLICFQATGLAHTLPRDLPEGWFGLGEAQKHKGGFNGRKSRCLFVSCIGIKALGLTTSYK